MDNNSRVLTLGDLKTNERAEVTGFQRDSREIVDKLLAMGITRGATVNVVRFAPLGDPMDVEVKGMNLSLRAEEAKIVHVRRGE